MESVSDDTADFDLNAANADSVQKEDEDKHDVVAKLV